MRSLAAICILLVLSLLAGLAGAQSGRPATTTQAKPNERRAVPSPTATPLAAKPADDTVIDDGEVIKVDTKLASVPVRVMDKKGRFVGGLVKENFRVFEDGVEQEIAHFSNETAPFTVALVLDMSYSTTFKIAEIQSAAIAFIEQLRPDDKVMVISFAEEVHMLCEATSDRGAIYRAIRSTKIATGTSLYEAVDLVINNRLRRIEGRKAIILFTDGVDTTSRRAHDRNNLDDAMELDALIYPIRYDTFADVQSMKNKSILVSNPIPIPGSTPTPFPIPPILGTPSSQGTTPEEYKRAEEYLDQLALRTGGRMYPAATLGNLNDAYSKIASELREFYSIGFYPNEDRVAGKTTTVKVRVNRSGLVVRARETYIRRKKSK
jgi:Ca-activated chloride channel homolog